MAHNRRANQVMAITCELIPGHPGIMRRHISGRYREPATTKAFCAEQTDTENQSQSLCARGRINFRHISAPAARKPERLGSAGRTRQ